MSRAPFDRLDPGGGGGSDNDENGTDNGNGDEEESVEATGSRTDFVLSEVEEQAAESEAEVEEESRTLEEEVRDAGTPGVDFRRGPSTGRSLGAEREMFIDEQREEFAEDIGVDPDAVNIEERTFSGSGTFQRFEEEQDVFVVAEDERRRLFEEQLDEEYPDTDFEIEQEDGRFRAVPVEDDPGFFDDPVGVTRDRVVGTGSSAVSQVGESGSAIIDDPRGAVEAGAFTTAAAAEGVITGRPVQDAVPEIDIDDLDDFGERAVDVGEQAAVTGAVGAERFLTGRSVQDAVAGIDPDDITDAGSDTLDAGVDAFEAGTDAARGAAVTAPAGLEAFLTGRPVQDAAAGIDPEDITDTGRAALDAGTDAASNVGVPVPTALDSDAITDASIDTVDAGTDAARGAAVTAPTALEAFLTGRPVQDAAAGVDPGEIEDFGQGVVDSGVGFGEDASLTGAVAAERFLAGRPQRETIEGIRDDGVVLEPEDLTEEQRVAVLAGAGVAAIPEPTPATETAGLVIAGGAIASAGVAQWVTDELEIDPEETSTPSAEIDVVEEDFAEVQVPDQFEDTTEVEVVEEAEFQEVEVPTEQEFVDPTQDPVQTRQQFVQGQIFEDPEQLEEDDGNIVIGEEDIVDPDELRERDLQELREQVEEMAEYSRSGVEEHVEEDIWTGDVTDEPLEETQPEVTTEPAQDFDSGFGQGPAQLVDEITVPGVDDGVAIGPDAGVDTITEIAPIEDIGVDIGQLPGATTPATGDGVTVATPEVTVPEVLEPTFTGQGPGRSGRRRRRRMPQTPGGIGDIENIPDPSVGIDDEQVEFFVPDPEDIGLSMEDIDDIQP